MGKITMDKSKQEKQAGDVVNKMFAVLIGISFPLQIYFNVPGKALFEIFQNQNKIHKILVVTGFDLAPGRPEALKITSTPKRHWQNYGTGSLLPVQNQVLFRA